MEAMVQVVGLSRTLDITVEDLLRPDVRPRWIREL